MAHQKVHQVVPAVSSPPGHGGVTTRAVCLGLFASILIGLTSAYSDCYLTNTLLVGNHFPMAAIVFIAFLVLVVNTAVKRFLGVPGLASGELLLIWGMVGIAGSLSSYSFVGYFPSFVAAPAYFTTASNDYRELILNHIPDWMVVSKDPDSRAVRWFMEGMPSGQSIPWAEWVGPLVAWCGFAVILYASNFALCAVFFQQWSQRERLIFPIVHVPVEVARPAPPDRLLNDFLRNRLTWIGVAIPCLIWGVRGLATYIPAMPEFDLLWSTWGLFANRPWSEFHLRFAEIFFAVIGLTFLLTREVGFSFWFFFVLYRLSYVFVAWLGAAGTGFFGNWGTRASVFETAGGMIAVAVFLCWTARKSLTGWFRRALSGRTDPEQDVLPPCFSFLLIGAGFLVMVGWYVLAGAQWWVGVLAVVMYLTMLLVLTRVVAESGLLFLGGITEPFRFITQLFPSSWLTGASLTTLAMQRGINTEDMRKVFMPYIINGMKAAEHGRVHLGKALAAFALAAGVALAVATYSFIATSHKYGAVNVEWWASALAPRYYLDDAAKRQKNPPDYNVLKIGEQTVLPVNLAHVLVGGAFVAGLYVVRTIFPWWPLHPLGFVMCTTWAMSRIWFSIFLGWLAKFLIMSFAGARAYQRALPLFLGMVLGECMIAMVWAMVGLITGVPNVHLTA